MTRLATFVAFIIVASPAYAGDRPLIIASGTVASALSQLSAQSGISVSIEDPSLWAKPVAGFSAAGSPEAALRRILGAAGARPVKLGTSVYRAVSTRPSPPPARAPRPATPPEPVAEGEVVVTASKRDLRLLDFPAAVEILDGSRFVSEGERGTDTIVVRLASVSSTYLGAGRNKLFIRGIADSSFTGPTQGTVGQYLGDIRLTYNAPDPDLRLYDIGSVEVLEGPQGTLYGAGSLGGILRTNPNAPVLNQIGGTISAGVSATAHGSPGGDLGGWLNLPVSSDAALRLVGYGITEGGYIDDVEREKRNVNRTRTVGGRGTFLYEPGDGWRVQAGAVLQSNHGRDSQYADRDLPPLERASPTPGGFDSDYRLASLSVEKKWSSLRFQSSSGLVRHRLTEQYDATIDPTRPQLFVQRNRTAMFTTENRLWSPLRNGFGWVVGASYTHNRTTLGRRLGSIAAPAPTTGVTNIVNEITAFAEASVQRSFLTITGGIRVTHDRLTGSAKDIPFASFQNLLRSGVTASRSEDNIMPSGALSARIGNGALAFLRYQEGIRPGGLAVEGAIIRRFKGDHIRSIETGLRFGEGARQLIGGALSASYSRWNDIQADYIDDTGLPSTSNIGTGRIYSVSGSLRIKPTPRLVLELATTYNDSRVTEPSAAFLQSLVNQMARFDLLKAQQIALDPLGRIPNVAKFSSRVSARYEVIRSDASTLTLEGWTRYVGRSRLGVGPVLGGQQGQYSETGLSAKLAKDRFGITLGVSNLFDVVGNRFALGTPFARELSQITPLRPRTVRLSIERHF
ncbi:TonB-dependent receptor [Sphingomonas sp.]|uniref:TonB-dependent receptor n=1 Tax=Sphingomonas sp. TaxID=28214 RepID=UPI003B3A0512